VKTVLGLSVTPSSVGWAVLDGSGNGAATLDHDVVDVAGRPSDDISRHIGAVRAAQAIAAASGQNLTSICVTWSDDAAATAYLVLRALPTLGFDKVVPVRCAGAGDDSELTARAAALALTAGVDTVPVALVRREPAVTPTPKRSRLAPARAAVLVAGLSALFVAGPEFAGQTESPTPEIQTASDSPASWESVHAVAVPAAPSPPPVTVRLVAGHAPPSSVEEAAPEVTEVVVPDTPVGAESVGVPHMPAQQVAASSIVGAPAPGPTVPAPVPVEAPPDPAQFVFSPLLGALP